MTDITEPPFNQAEIERDRTAVADFLLRLRRKRITDPRVLAAFEAVPRRLFVPHSARDNAYLDRALPIECGQSISAPELVAMMTAALDVPPGAQVLEIGTGSGYQAAVLAELGAEVYTIEIVAPLGERARAVLAELGYDRVHVRVGDGYAGWPEHHPFDAILLTAAPPQIPRPLLEQLRVGGHLVAPVGAPSGVQELVVVTRTDEGLSRRRVIPVRFVPMTGRAQTE